VIAFFWGVSGSNARGDDRHRRLSESSIEEDRSLGGCNFLCRTVFKRLIDSFFATNGSRYRHDLVQNERPALKTSDRFVESFGYGRFVRGDMYSGVPGRLSALGQRVALLVVRSPVGLQSELFGGSVRLSVGVVPTLSPHPNSSRDDFAGKLPTQMFSGFDVAVDHPASVRVRGVP